MVFSEQLNIIFLIIVIISINSAMFNGSIIYTDNAISFIDFVLIIYIANYNIYKRNKYTIIIIILRHIENMESKIFLSNRFVFLPDVCQLSSHKQANIGCSRV